MKDSSPAHDGKGAKKVALFYSSFPSQRKDYFSFVGKYLRMCEKVRCMGCVPCFFLTSPHSGPECRSRSPHTPIYSVKWYNLFYKLRLPPPHLLHVQTRSSNEMDTCKLKTNSDLCNTLQVMGIFFVFFKRKRLTT